MATITFMRWIAALPLLAMPGCWGLYDPALFDEREPPPLPEDSGTTDTREAMACDTAPVVPRETDGGVGCSIDRIYTATASIGRDGGTLTLKGTNPHGVELSIRIPPRALETTVEFTLSEINETPLVSAATPVYTIEPLGVVFLKPIEIVLPMHKFGSGAFGPGITAAYFAPNGATPFVAIGDAYTNAGFYNIETTRTGLFVSGPATCELGAVCR